MKPVDIIITFDTTGSMAPCIAEVRRKVTELTNDLFDKFTDLRIGVLVHGDYCDEKTSYIFDDTGLTQDRNSIVNFINSVGNTHGGDWEECYEFVIHWTRQSKWRTEAEKIVIMIGDAVPHAIGYRYGSITNKLDWVNELDKANTDGITYYAVQCLNQRNSNSFWNAIATKTGGKYIQLNQFNQIVDLLTLAVYALHDQQMAQDYAEPLLMNRGFREIAQSILGTSIGSHISDVRHDGLIPVDPARFQRLNVGGSDIGIKDFVQLSGATFRIGKGFYQLTKTELIQEHKEVVLVDRITGDMFSGDTAREMIGLSYGARGKINPYRLSHELKDQYIVFVQSTSPNRKLMKHSDFLYEVDIR